MDIKKILPSWLFSSAGLLAVLFAVLIGFVFFKGIDLYFIKFPPGIEVLHKAITPVPPGGAPAADLVPDIKKAGFAEYKQYLGVRESISITIVDTTTEFAIEARKGTEPGTGEFVVTPRQYQFFGEDIEKHVREGLEAVPSDDEPSHRPRWSGWSIETNKAERAWTVRLHGLSGEGRVRLDIATASAFLDTHLPRLLPIWNLTHFVDPRNGIVVIGRHDMEVKDVIAPDVSKDLCGFRILSLSSRSVWFEVVNATPSTELTRVRWPDVRIDWRELDNGQSRSMLVFESGHKMIVGDKAVFDEQGDALRLDAGAFLDERAVRLRYLDRHDSFVADLVVVTFH